MKKTIVFLPALALYLYWTQIPSNPPSLAPARPPIEAPTPLVLSLVENQKSLPASTRPNEEQQLREKLAQIDHELARAGYPEVLMEERLSEAERDELIAKVLLSTNLYNQIVQLKIASVQGRRQ